MAKTWVAPNADGIQDAELVYHAKPGVALCNVEIKDDDDTAILILDTGDIDKLIGVLEKAKKDMEELQRRMR